MSRQSQKLLLCTYTGHIFLGADVLVDQPVPDLPGKDGRAFPLVLGNLLHHIGRGNPGLGAADGPGLDGTSLVVPVNSRVLDAESLIST